MEIKYSVSFGKNSKTIKLKRNMLSITALVVITLLSTGTIFFGYAVDSTIAIILGIIAFMFFSLLTIMFILMKFEINLDKNNNTIRLISKKFFKGKEDREIPFLEIRHLTKRHSKVGSGAQRQDIYRLIIVLESGEEILLMHPSNDVKGLDEIKNIIVKYTGVNYQSNYNY